MNSINQVTVSGRLTRDAETRQAGRNDVTSFNIAVNKSWKGQDNEWKESTVFLEISCWGRLSEKARNLRKRDLVVVTGELEERQWEDRNGGGKRTKVQVKAKTLAELVPPPRRDDGGRGRDDRGGGRDDRYDDRGRDGGRDDRGGYDDRGRGGQDDRDRGRSRY